MTPHIAKRSVLIGGRKTSVSVEDIFWASLKEIARIDGMTLTELVAAIATSRMPGSNLSSAIRVHILNRFQEIVQILSSNVAAPVAAPPPAPVARPAGRAFRPRWRPR